ncbi:2,4-dienoyl-CoA reductase [Sporobacter termitidis DSM 10068]|uniref:2,4-dienoyl-CoA reductase n=1 Tax=Sporobacter termitidis DSM 10068 TaxID=1123282 RepID=A0A1M5XXQ7_9FIRM|nr:FAD-dependent oxidoreductase [Sporobacter termitidis]SHI04033.1 2,4-dienoyl-CoA reductase [Sporobacter termitidis DSM 10068]
MKTTLEKTFTPFRIGNCEIPNRLVVSPMVANMNPEKDGIKGLASEQYIRYHEEKAKGGWGLIITEDYLINPHAGGYPHIAALYDEAQIASHKKLTDTIHKYGSKIFCQIYHAGRQANHFVNGGVQPVSSSPIACAWNKEVPHQLAAEEIHQIVRDFGITAANVVEAGFDGLEIHAAHGYLIHQFLSPNSNKRIDDYGGTYENRTRFLREVMQEVRRAVGSDFPMQVRFSAQEFCEGGRTMFESRQIIRDIEEWGADALHLSSSMYGTRSSQGIVPSFFQNHGWIVKFAEEAKTLVKIPVITVGRISDPLMVEDILDSGKADAVAMGRASLCDPHWPEKAKSGDFNDIRTCIGCLQGCTASTYQGVPLYCLVNPELGHEYETDYSKAAKQKFVIVAGGGVGGMEAARAAATKGHKVHLFEASNELGGQFVTAAFPPNKGEFATYPAWLLRQLKKLNVEIHLHTPVTAEVVKTLNPDKVIIATGAKPIIPNLPGIDLPNVVTAEDILRGRVDTGMNVLVAGGGMIGSETAAYLCVQCKSKVTVIEMLPDIGLEMEAGIRDDLKTLLLKYFVDIKTGTKLAGVTAEGALIQQGDTMTLFSCDTIVLAIGTRAYNPLEEELKGLCDVVVVGDAVKARKAIQASREGFLAGIQA